MSYDKDKMTSELNKLADKINSVTNSTGKKTIPEMREALNGVVVPEGLLQIQDTEIKDVSTYSQAQVVDNNLIAENIKKDISILGVTGTLVSGSGGSLKTLLDATKSADSLFNGYKGTSVDDLISYSDTENVTNLENMFYECSNIASIPLLDTSNATNMRYMFYNCSKIPTIPQFKTSKVTMMNYLFHQCYRLTSIPQLDTSNVTTMYYMFYKCSNLTSISQLDTSNVTDMRSMFYYCTNLTSIPQLNTSNVTMMNQMFNNCQKLTSIPQLDTSKLNEMSYMFSACHKLTTIDLTHMKIPYTSYTSGICLNCYSLTKFIIRNMDTIPPLDSNSFNNCYHFTGTTNATYNPEGLKDGRIYVPDDKVEALKTATNWSAYADIIVPLSTLVEE